GSFDTLVLPPFPTRRSSDLVFGAVVVIGIVLVAVFVPVAFFPGTTGRLYQQFSLTIAVAVVLSVFNAVTLTPALSALLLEGHTTDRKSTRLNSSHVKISYAA